MMSRKARLGTMLLLVAGRISFAAVLAVVICLAAGTPRAANAHSYKLGDIAIGHIWAPPPEQGATAVPVYGPLLNRGAETVWLIGASTALAETVRFRTEKDGAVQWPTKVALPSGKPVGLAAWREHIWLSGLKQPLKDGDTFDLTLDFGAAGTLTVKVIVEKTGSH